MFLSSNHMDMAPQIGILKRDTAVSYSLDSDL